ncbi:MAG: hypothetical protein O8C63_12735 [Candidatus Methanoperedens sp.]|nr:hypothetical protein [Candidatus Methanoperedens sp.]
MLNKIELWEKKYDNYIIILYCALLILISFGLKNLFTDSRDFGYMSTSAFYMVIKKLWLSFLTFCFGLFYGIAIIAGYYDWTRRKQSYMILFASLIIVVAYTYIVILRPLMFFSGLIAGAFISHITRRKEKDYINCKTSLMILAIVSSAIVWLTLLNYIAGRSEVNASIIYILLALLFSVVIYMFAVYAESECKLFIVGPRKSGKTVFTAALYEEARKKKRVIGNPNKNLSGIYTELHGKWPDATKVENQVGLKYIHGRIFTKEVDMDIDYAGDILDTNIKDIINVLNGNNLINIDNKPIVQIRLVADGIKNASRLIFLIDPDKYLFSWDEIPGNDNIRLKDVLSEKYGLDLGNTKINKSNDKTINVSDNEKSVSLNLNNNKVDVYLKNIDGKIDKIGELTVKFPYIFSDNYIVDIYKELLDVLEQNGQKKPYYFVVTKCDKLSECGNSRENYEKFKECVLNEIRKDPDFKTIERESKGILPVMVLEKNNAPERNETGFIIFGYDAVLDEVGK